MASSLSSPAEIIAHIAVLSLCIAVAAVIWFVAAGVWAAGVRTLNRFADIGTVTVRRIATVRALRLRICVGESDGEVIIAVSFYWIGSAAL